MPRNLRAGFWLGAAGTDLLEALMNACIEYAHVGGEAVDLATEEDVEMDASDRHVHAACITADAGILLAHNTVLVPAMWMAEQH